MHIVWPSYRGIANHVGMSASEVSVYYDPALGAPGLKNAQDLLADADRIVAIDDVIFGQTADRAINVIIFAIDGKTDGTGGADHMSCNFDTGGNIEVCAAFGNSAMCGALFEAELSECHMGGNLCGVETGEALSRWCAAVASNDALAAFATAPLWAKSGMPNWVDRLKMSDRSFVPIGCAMAFLSWLMSEGHKLDEIAKYMVKSGSRATLAQLYQTLTKNPTMDAWPAFMADVKKLPEITSDDPFHALEAMKIGGQVVFSRRLDFAHTIEHIRQNDLDDA